MANHDRGQCKNCRYFNSHSARPEGSEVAQCQQPELEDFALEVSGDSGCNAFEARAEADRSYGVGDDASAVMH